MNPEGHQSGTLPEALIRIAGRFPHRGIGIFDRRGKSFERRTYGELLAAARLSAARLAALGVEPGDRVMVCLPTSWPALEAWLGALIRGAWPVMLAPAGPLGAAEAHAQKLDGIVQRLGVRRLIGEAAFKHVAEACGATQAAAIASSPEELAGVTPASPFKAFAATPADVAFLQLTSGSTGLQRAVMISHRAALHNPAAIDDAVSSVHGAPSREWTDAVVSWLPLYHDMGMIGCVFFAITNGLDLWLMRPETFLARPRLWLEWLGKLGRTLSPAPNFAYQLCVERIAPAEFEGIDLSSWRAAVTGAEMIRPETTAAFSRIFGARGFRAEAFRPSYGMAEATLAITFDRKGQGVRTVPLPRGLDGGLGLPDVVCTGRPVLDTHVRICAPDGTALPEGSGGEVRVQGPSVFNGYFGDPEASAASLKDGWLCTGDVGFLRDGELYLTGRTKDLLIVHGQNIMPHELEWLAESITGGGGAERCAAFSVAKGAEGEEAVLVLEAGDRDAAAREALSHEIRVRIGRALGLPLADVVFVRRGQIPKTTSGKVQRSELRRRYLDGQIERV